MPRPSPSGAGLRLPELSRIRLRDDLMTTKPKKRVPFRGDVDDATVACAADPGAAAKSRTEPCFNREPVVAVIEHPDVAELLPGVAAGSGGAVAAHRVAVQIEGDVVGADHDPVVRAVDRSLSSVVSAVIVSPH